MFLTLFLEEKKTVGKSDVSTCLEWKKMKGPFHWCIKCLPLWLQHQVAFLPLCPLFSVMHLLGEELLVILELKTLMLILDVVPMICISLSAELKVNAAIFISLI